MPVKLNIFCVGLPLLSILVYVDTSTIYASLGDVAHMIYVYAALCQFMLAQPTWIIHDLCQSRRLLH